MNLPELLSHPPVYWFITGLALAALELAAPGLVLIFFAAGAWLVAISCLAYPIGITPQLILFSVFSVLSLWMLRSKIKKKFFSGKDEPSAELEEEFIGQTATAISAFAAGRKGRVMLRGTEWSAIAEQDIAKGQEVLIVSHKSITFNVRPLADSQ
jgi:inner membrane protein